MASILIDASPRRADAVLEPAVPVSLAAHFPWAAHHHPDSQFRPDTPPVETSPSASTPGTASPATTVSESQHVGSVSVSPHEAPLVAVLGVGYVGAHLVDSFSSHYPVIGFDVSEKRVRELRERERERGDTERRVRYESDPVTLARARHFLIAVPTLLRPDRSIDSSSLRSAVKMVGLYARMGSTVVIESSVAVGMTRDLLGPLAAERGFFAGMSPERVDPGRVEPPMHSIPKIISGLESVTPGSLEAISKLYKPVFDRLIPVSTPEVAEMTKLYENCQRMVCIAYANEMADACVPLGIDPFEVCAAASTKPFGYAPFAPSLGVGGHCIPVNPFYLLSNCPFPILEQATAAMWQRPQRIAQRAMERLKMREMAGDDDLAPQTPRVLVVGLGFKPGQSNLSNSPGVELVKSLVVSQEVDVTWADALVPQEALAQVKRLPDEEWTRERMDEFDLVVVSFRQHGMDMSVLEGLDNTEVEMWCP